MQKVGNNRAPLLLKKIFRGKKPPLDGLPKGKNLAGVTLQDATTFATNYKVVILIFFNNNKKFRHCAFC